MRYSPFPGMDPYLEAPPIWPDVHTSLISIFREQLTPLLAPKYLAELETQVVIDRLDDEPQIVLPDVSVTTPEVPPDAASTVAVAAPTPVQIRVPLDVPTHLVSLHLRQRETRRLVAVIELLSPVNKRRGKGRDEYLEKRRALLSSPVHVIEIDLLRSYPRMPFDDPLPPTHYLVMVCNAGERPNSRGVTGRPRKSHAAIGSSISSSAARGSTSSRCGYNRWVSCAMRYRMKSSQSPLR